MFLTRRPLPIHLKPLRRAQDGRTRESLPELSLSTDHIRPAGTVKWRVSWVICRVCGAKHVTVYPSNIDDEQAMECPFCRGMSCGPVEGEIA